MIEVKIQEVAYSIGIKNAYQFQKYSGLPVSMANRIYKGKWKRVDLKTLNTICNTLKCTPSDVLRFTRDSEEDLL